MKNKPYLRLLLHHRGMPIRFRLVIVVPFHCISMFCYQSHVRRWVIVVDLIGIKENINIKIGTIDELSVHFRYRMKKILGLRLL